MHSGVPHICRIMATHEWQQSSLVQPFGCHHAGPSRAGSCGVPAGRLSEAVKEVRWQLLMSGPGSVRHAGNCHPQLLLLPVLHKAWALLRDTTRQPSSTACYIRPPPETQQQATSSLIACSIRPQVCD